MPRDGCHGGVPVFDGVDPRYKRILWTVIGLNATMFVVEMVMGHLAGSQALQADALDFLADTVTYGLSLAVIGTSLRTRATAALFKGLSLSLMALWVLGSTVYHPRPTERRVDGRDWLARAGCKPRKRGPPDALRRGRRQCAFGLALLAQ